MLFLEVLDRENSCFSKDYVINSFSSKNFETFNCFPGVFILLKKIYRLRIILVVPNTTRLNRTKVEEVEKRGLRNFWS